MKSFNDFYISSKSSFWAINFTSLLLVVWLIGFIFNFKLREILMQLGIGTITTFLLVWTLGGYNKIKHDYLQRKDKRNA